ncbi:MAG: radical SAM family heme chaperone HemW [Deltaproteobacteria bacterium]|nr:radical SAM family heme chaperone HemW [Deltaproteobacteria bacterium]
MVVPAAVDREPALYDDSQVGVYLHLPFCERICPYCDFAVVAARPLEAALEARYVAALRAELERRRGDFSGRSLASLYFGGGTPSLFGPDSIRELIDAVHRAFEPGAAGVETSVETTLELNPSTTEIDRLPGFREAGIDRLSIGVQSFDDVQLKRLGRAHSAATVRETLRAVRSAGFRNISIDLIFAAPQQATTDLERDLDEVIEWSPEHLSTYELTYEAQTPFGRALAAGKMNAPDEDRSVEMIETIEARLRDAGYERYEISNYARPGRRSRHNARYWQRLSVLGLGMGAHSTEVRAAHRPHGARRANPRGLMEWLEAVEAGEAVGVEESPSPATARGEAVFLALRQREGLSARRFEAEFGAAPRTFFAAAIDDLVAKGWLAEGGSAAGDLRLTRAGRLLADSVAAEFVALSD